MALTLGQKAVRVMKFLRGVRHPRVFGALAAHGFDGPVLEEGWTLLRESSGAKLEVPTVVPFKAEVYDRLDELENMWFPISRATLRRNHPEVEKRVFLNLRQTTGVEVSISVGTFVERIEALDASEDPDDRAARALLERRGVTDAVISQMKALLQQLETTPAPAPIIRPSAAEVAQAEAAMWEWYLEWSVVARQALHDRRLLRALGFLTASGMTVPEDQPTEEDIVDNEEADSSVAAE